VAAQPREAFRLPADLDLLRLEIDTLWTTDQRGRLLKSRDQHKRAAPHLVIAVSNDGQTVAFGSEVADALVVELRAVVESAPRLPPATPPASLARCEQLLTDTLGPVEVSSGPGYVIPPPTAFESAAVIVKSDGEDTENLRDQVPEWQGWRGEDWNLMLDGFYGPWAVATVDGQVIAYCHCARLTDRGAEAGVGTHPGFRGQGHAAAATAAWASLLADSGRHLFYSTSADNLSSQRVAARLNLRPIGWMWQLSYPRWNV
jgi:RimJ/RimL family protein N-acetyltransferase